MNKVYGIDLQADGPVIIAAEKVRGRIACAEVFRDNPAFRKDLAAGVACAGCLSSRESFVRVLEAPFASISKARRVFPTLLDVGLPFPLEECVVEFIAPRRTGRTVRALAVAARSSDVRKKLDAYLAAGVDPVLLDAEAPALWSQALREAALPDAQSDALRAILWLAHDRSTLVVGRGRNVLGAHSTKPGDTVQIVRFMKQYAPAGTPVNWVWAGPGLSNSGQFVGIQTQLLKEWPGGSVQIDQPHALLARAIATRALTATDLPCNLRTGELAHKGLSAMHPDAHVRIAVAAIIAGALLCAVNIAGLGGLKWAATHFRDRFMSVSTELTGQAPGGMKGERAVKLIRENVQARLAAGGPFVEPFRPPLTLAVTDLAKLAALNRIHIDNMTLTRTTVAMEGTAEDWSAPELILGQLRSTGMQAKLDRREANDEERIPFTITTAGKDD